MEKRFFLVLMNLFLLFSIFGCKEDKDYPDPTKAFYVNDFANKLTPAVESTITREGERLFEFETEDGDKPGVQIVFATFLVKNETDVASYNLSDIYNQWGIGKDDLGILVVYFYVEDIDDSDISSLKQVQIEIGYQMEVYLSPSEAGQILDNTIMSGEDEQIETAHLLYELLSEVYLEIYDRNFTYNMDEYQIYMDTFDEYADHDDIWSWILYVVLSPSSSWWEKGVLTMIGLSILGASGGLVKNIGGGGRSGGMGIRRRK